MVGIIKQRQQETNITKAIYKQLFMKRGFDMIREEHHFLSEETVSEASTIFKALGDPTRIKILYLLSQEECSVNHIAEVLGMSQSAVSHQLATLRKLRLV